MSDKGTEQPAGTGPPVAPPDASGDGGADGAPPAPVLPEHERRSLRESGRSWEAVPDVHLGSDGSPYNPDLGGIERRGGRPGERYIRSSRSQRQGFQPKAPGWLQATLRASEPQRGSGRLWRRVRNVVLGHPLASAQMSHERISKTKALAVLSSDSLSSIAYGPEAILVILVLGGSAALGSSIPIMIAIAALLAVLIVSYRQVIRAYPNAGGSYVVAKDNLGPFWGLLAGAALVTDYILTVAVSVAAGVAAITSAAPEAGRFTVEMCVGIIIVIVLGNLRGIRESASLFAIPTYLFVASMLLMIAVVFIKYLTGSAQPQPEHAVKPVEGISVFLILRAYASGCSSLTGIEALSNSVPAFKPVEWRNARTTLSIMGVLLGVMFVGTTLAAHVLRLVPRHNETLVSQMAHIGFGNSVLYFIVTAATTGVLVLAANTSFTGFPRLFYFVASDDYAPRQLKRYGDRLALSNGILLLGVLAIILVVAFNGNVDRLIPLYTIGVFLAFTLANVGMVRRWLRLHEPGWRRGLAINGVGMVMSGAVFLVTAGTKFQEGAWVVLLIIPVLISLAKAVHRHYAETAGSLAPEIPIVPTQIRPLCIVPIADLNGVALQSLAFARTISDRVIAVHVTDDEEQIARIRAKWETWGRHVPLEIIESPFRSLVRPLLSYIDGIDKQSRGEATLVVVLPELVATRWWQQLLHNQSALRIKAALLFRPGTVVVNVPYHLRRVSRARRRLRVRDRDRPLDDDL